jgi:hypothetical protein
MLAISHLMLSEVPCTNEPLVDTLPELFITFPTDKVSNWKEAEADPYKIAGTVAFAAVKLPEPTRVTNNVSPPCWK